MNKTQEIAFLRAILKELGDDSYTGPWLREQLPVIESEITSDLPAGTHSFTLAQARAEATRIIAQANDAAVTIEELARASAKRTNEEAWDFASRLKEEAKRSLHAIADRI
jgi:cell division septum initiation protein DivIVA